MNMKTDDELAHLAVDWIRRNDRETGTTNGKIDRSTNLLADGVLDSIGFLELISYLEQESGGRIELLDAELEEIATVDGLIRYVSHPSS